MAVQAFGTNRHFVSHTRRLSSPPSMDAESFANGTSSVYFDQMYEQWRADPASVHPSWKSYFENVEKERDTAYVSPPNLGQTGTEVKLDQIV